MYTSNLPLRNVQSYCLAMYICYGEVGAVTVRSLLGLHILLIITQQCICSWQQHQYMYVI